ncbi:rhomboid family intramembrane serine protease [Methylotenera sp.]|uniref:rhomboid family intramembrane serine protease n=1 Tax=Methylotenera sp. TaxID=2051956 RepID=UPI00272F3288|nr:rhomboid family intramembrane serine protease [Methylotenera sp.]MDP2229620.1 rhomboid family intramembrane serine protease [Methylotenera sp.]
MQSLHVMLKQRTSKVWVTKLLIATNVLVFLAMIVGGAGIWHSPNNVQLAWGANFGPATQDGEWWRLGSAMFLHFGVVHLVFNLWALWDAGQLVERMYGHVRFVGIYFMSGLAGNLVSLVIQGNSAVSGGASGAVFGIYGALLTFLWRERKSLAPHEFRWLFWGALAFASITIALGFIIPGIDNSAHIGGFVTGILASVIYAQSITAKVLPKKIALASACIMIASILMLILNIPAPKYRWSDEMLIRKEIDEFLQQDQAINRSWLEIMHESKQGSSTFDGLAGEIDSAIGDRYEESFEKLSQLPLDPALPSASKVEDLLEYAQHRKDESRQLAEKLRNQSLLVPPQ